MCNKSSSSLGNQAAALCSHCCLQYCTIGPMGSCGFYKVLVWRGGCACINSKYLRFRMKNPSDCPCYFSIAYVTLWRHTYLYSKSINIIDTIILIVSCMHRCINHIIFSICYTTFIFTIYYPLEVGKGEYWGLGVFLLQYFPLVEI